METTPPSKAKTTLSALVVGAAGLALIGATSFGWGQATAFQKGRVYGREEMQSAVVKKLSEDLKKRVVMPGYYTPGTIEEYKSRGAADVLQPNVVYFKRSCEEIIRDSSER